MLIESMQLMNALFNKDKQIKISYELEASEELPVYINREQHTYHTLIKNLESIKEDEFLMVFDLDFTLYGKYDIEVRAYEIFNKFKAYIDLLNNQNGYRSKKLKIFVKHDQTGYYILNKVELKKWNEWNRIEDSLQKYLFDLCFKREMQFLDLVSFLRPKKELIDILSLLKNTSEKKFRFIVLTDASEEHTKRVLMKLKIESMFEAVFCHDRSKDPLGSYGKNNHGAFKFVEKYYNLALLSENTPVYFNAKKHRIKFKIPVKNILFFDDQKVNIQTARKNDWDAVLVLPDDILTEKIMSFAFEYSQFQKNSDQC